MKAILEKVVHDQSRSFIAFEYTRHRFRCPYHYHPEYEITLITGSRGLRYVGDHIGRFEPGDLVLLGPQLPHMYINDATFAGRASAVVTQFLPGDLGGDFLRLPELGAIRALLERARAGIAFQGPARTRAATLVQKLPQQRGFARMRMLLEVLEILAGTRTGRTLASPGYAPALAPGQGERINRVCELISTRFREGITQAEAARAARMSAPSFSRFFRRATNRTFPAFVNEVRIGHASRLLLESDATVAEICYASGFANLSNFNRQFLRARRVSPRNYRRQRSAG